MDKLKVIDEKGRLIEELQRINKELLSATISYKTVQNIAWLETDFSEALEKSRPTVDEKKAYVSNLTINHKKKRDELQLEKEIILLNIELCGDKLNL